MARPIMVQGTTSNAGKSLLTAGLCRVFRQDGYRVAPFKSQNMALNSYITTEGLEMGRAQVMQAEAAGIEPSVNMNPILLKPTGDTKSQVIVNGEVVGNMSVQEYGAYKNGLAPDIRKAYDTLAEQADIIVIEGAGSPAEINLKTNDIVNMGMAAMVDAPVLLVGDIDRGGVFASLYGTVALLDEEEQARIKGLVINKFRGDIDLLKPGLAMLEDLCRIPVLGVLPYLYLDLDDEDSLSPRLTQQTHGRLLDIAVIRLPHISNFTDFNPLQSHESIGLRYIEKVSHLRNPDLILLPGTKNTMSDLAWMRQNGLEAEIKKRAGTGTPVMGICGGYQMLGSQLLDPDNTEHGGEMAGMGLLPVKTRFVKEKTRTLASGEAIVREGFYSCLNKARFKGYEIHMGTAEYEGSIQHFAKLARDGKSFPASMDGIVYKNVLGSYVHGLFDSGEILNRLVPALLEKKGLSSTHLSAPAKDYRAVKEEQYDLLAAALRSALDFSYIYQVIGL